MREHKYKGKRIDGGGWVYGYYVKAVFSKNTAHCIYVNLETESGIKTSLPIEVIPETVGEYIGLKDKNGVEIYDGDILTSAICKKCIVMFDSIKGFHAQGDKHHIRPENFRHRKLIGNIHEQEASNEDPQI